MRALLAAGIAAALFAALAALTLAGAFGPFDHAVHGVVQEWGAWDGPAPDPDDTDPEVRGRWSSSVPGARHVGSLGDWRSAVGAALALAAALWAAGRGRSAAVAVAAAAANGVATVALQAVFVPLAAPLRAGGPYPQMLPSGHTMGALFTAGLVAAMVLHRLRGTGGRRADRATVAAAAGFGLLVGVARILEAQHLPSDVLAGAAAGAAVLGLALAADARWGG